ncbi:hypothetical protein FS749_012775 [Ceratobasidium sp. UAMH 11750]|nr:hypothetical protein FS749_012775 [Ceratobasidium sp. UAMH 11750]
MDIKIYAGYMVDNQRIREWLKVQTDPELAKCFSEGRNVPLVALRRYFRLKKLSKHIGLTGLPYPKGGPGGQDISRWYLVFYRRHGEYRVSLRQFSEWEEYEEQEEDRKYKEILKNIFAGLELTDWTVAAWVGTVGLFYGFSKEVIDGIYERSEIARAERLKREAAGVSSTTSGAST